MALFLPDGCWIVIQRRVDASVSFEKGWSWYVNGFGDVNGNYWMGLEAIHDLTSAQQMSLQIDIVQENTEPLSITYHRFHVGDAASEYLLTIDNDAHSGTSDYGTLYNSFNYHNGQRFSTYDHDNDEGPSYSCASNCRGGWWFMSCHTLLLNGVYSDTLYISYLDTYSVEPIRTVAMKIRPN